MPMESSTPIFVGLPAFFKTFSGEGRGDLKDSPGYWKAKNPGFHRVNIIHFSNTQLVCFTGNGTAGQFPV